MAITVPKDPTRVRSGCLGALSVHARSSRAAGNLALHAELDSEPENAKPDSSRPASGTAVRTDALDGAR